MIRLLLFFTSCVLLVSCKSFPDRVKAEKEKFVQFARENSGPLDINSLQDILEKAKENQSEKKLKYLRVDASETIYELADSNRSGLDSIVLFKRSDYRVVYDFSQYARDEEFMKKNLG